MLNGLLVAIAAALVTFAFHLFSGVSIGSILFDVLLIIVFFSSFYICANTPITCFAVAAHEKKLQKGTVYQRPIWGIITVLFMIAIALLCCWGVQPLLNDKVWMEEILLTKKVHYNFVLLTSYLLAAAIGIFVSGWLANRITRWRGRQLGLENIN